MDKTMTAVVLFVGFSIGLAVGWAWYPVVGLWGFVLITIAFVLYVATGLIPKGGA